ncbi:MAG: ATP-dependent Clp protease proteolytic subunit, partial [Cyanobacteria bacterium J06638_6]
ILYLKKQLNDAMAANTGQPLDKIAEDTERDFFMSPQEAVDYGLIDQVIDRTSVGSRPMIVK